MNAIKQIIFFLWLNVVFFESLCAQAIPSKTDTTFDYNKQFELAKSFHKQGKVDEAVKIHYLLLDYLLKHNNGSKTYYTKLAENYQSLTNLYVFENDSLALLYANKAIAAANKTGDTALMERSYSFKYFSLYNVPGSAHRLNALADTCIKYSLIAGNEKMLGEAYMHKCNALVELGKPEKGNSYCLKAEALFSQIDTSYFLAAVLGNIANVFVKSNQYEKALNYHLKAFNISKKLDNLSYLITDARNIAEDYYKLGNYKKSSEYYKIVTDSLEASYQAKLDKRFTDSEARFNAEQKDKEIALQKLEIAEKNKLRDRIIFGGLLVLMLIIGLFQWYLTKHKKKKQQAEQELQREQELNAMRKRFLENIAHEIRTPITLINGHLELAMENVSDAANVQKHIKTALSNSQKVLSNANEILDLLKLENKDLPMVTSEILLDSFFKRIFFSFASLAELKKIELKYVSGLEPNMAIKSDKDRIEKILNNFISNAVKFSPSGSKIVFEAAVHGNQLTVKVTDSGPGISKGEQKKIFNRFYQSSETSNVGGMGIGLSLANELAKSLDGKISVESESGKGATFIFFMPVEIYKVREVSGDKSLKTNEKKTNQVVINPHEKPKILIVEDNPEMNAYLHEILEPYYNCDTAFDGIEGLQKVQTSKYALILSDVMMPGIDGFEFKQKINNLNNYKNTPFIFITAKAQLENRIEGYRLGVDDYIVKPFAKEELIARIATLLANKQVRDNWAKENPELITQQGNSDEMMLAKFKSIIREHLSDESFKVSDLAKKAGYSTRQLSRVIKQSSGLTPLQFILEMRLQKAYVYLTEKRFATIAEVRNRVGMPGAAHFNKKFYERFGIKPSDMLQKRY